MKNLLMSAFAATLLFSCNQQTNKPTIDETKTTTETEAVEPIGGDKDEHGCLSSAGQTWSELKQNCIQVFNEGQRLDPIEPVGSDAVISAFAILNDDQSKAEIFLPNDEKKSVVLDKKSEGVFENATLKYVAAEKILYLNGEKKYEAVK